ncbi:hypothetical protein [Azohydromonas lata]|uniref:Uncharacterized protein n=1 Tax=Azohydromonas lata TaxID=45677 RepID=A0ABU5ICS5_9BURK|nr:hypothetical protein [Azohydromonas lata]MDZ5456896.1 hypothetical protein [Azohydromonas lata]
MNSLGLRLIEQWYQLDRDALRARFGFDDGAPGLWQTRLADSPVFRTGLFCGTHNLQGIAPGAVLCSGVCIADCIPSLTLECLAKIHSLMATAKLARATAILFVGVHGEKLKFPSLATDWDDVHQQVLKVAGKIARHLQLDDYHVCNTASFRHEPAVAHACSVISDHVPRDSLVNLYEIARNPGAQPLGTAGQIAATVECVAFNCASVLSSIYGRNFSQLVYFEDLQQAQVVQCARRVDAELLGQGSAATAGIYFCPFPNLRGDGRMYRSSQDDKIYAGDSLTKLTYQFSSMPAELLDFWRECFSDWNDGKRFNGPRDLAFFINTLAQ